MPLPIDSGASTTIRPLATDTAPAGPPPGIDPLVWKFSSPAEQASLRAQAQPAPSDDGESIFEKIGDAVHDIFEKIEDILGGGGAKPAMSENERIARKLVQPGGSGDQGDVDLVVAELAKMPVTALRAMDAGGVKVVACRGSVTDYATDLKGVQPRGWPPGATWDQVPGAYMPDRNAVVVAVRGHGTPEGAHVPKTGEGHGSANLVIHESAHAVDANVSPALNSHGPAFVEARNKDLAALSDYERQPGDAGLSETYAESAARYYGGGSNGKTPALDAYWRDHPLGGK